MTRSQAFSLKYNKILFRAALILLLAEILYAVISFHKAVPLFFQTLKRAGEISTAEADALFAPLILLNPANYQFLFFIAGILIILSFFRVVSVPEQLHVSIPSKFYRPIDVKHEPGELLRQIKTDPQYVKSMAVLYDHKAYERRAKREFLGTSAMLLFSFYVASILFKEHAIATMVSWCEPDGLLARPMAFLCKIIEPQWSVEAFAWRLFSMVSTCVILFGILFLILNFFRRKQYKASYTVETFDESRCLCKACGHACVDILELKETVETGRRRTGSGTNYVPYREYSEKTTTRGGSSSTRLKGYDVKIYRFDIYDVAYRDSYACRQCDDPTTRARRREEEGEKQYMGKKYMSADTYNSEIQEAQRKRWDRMERNKESRED